VRPRGARPQLKRRALGSTEDNVAPAVVRAFAVLCLAQALPCSVVGQAACTYDSCALWLGHGPGSTGVVRGHDTVPLATFSFVPSVDVLATAGDPIRQHYQVSRRHFRRSTVLGLLSLAGVFATMAYFGKDRQEFGWAVGLPVATLGLSVAGGVDRTKAENHFRQALWLYNRTLPAVPGVQVSDCTYDQCAIRLQPSFWSTALVQGINLERSGSPRANGALFRTADDSARFHFQSFVEGSARAAVGRRVGLSAVLGGIALYAMSRDKTVRGVGVGLLVVGYGIGHMALYARAAADTDLERAIWFYNRTLVSSP
jgi:hypothetical protein